MVCRSQQGQALVELIAVLMIVLVFFLAAWEWPRVVHQDLKQFNFAATETLK
jgi:competence protein ComGC